MHITILALGSYGDIVPYATLGRALKGAGHAVRFITFESFASLIAENQLDFHPVQGDAQSLVARAGADTVALVRSFGSLAEGYARDLSAPHLRDTDLIVNQLPAGLYGFDLAEKAGVPMMFAAVIPLVRTGAFPFVGLPRLPLPGYNKLTYLLGEQIAWQMFRPVINRWRTRTLGLPPHPLKGYFSEFHTRKIQILNGFSAHLVPRPADWGEQIHVTGYWFADDGEWQPPADLQLFVEAGRPPVFFGFGSMPIPDPQRTTALIVEALEHSGQRGILHSGWAGLGEQKLPDFVFKIDHAPYSWLFPRMALLVHHGGSGTTALGVRAGVPACAVPFVFDQFFWGKQITRLGAGPEPIPFKRLTAARLREAILLATTDATMQTKARELGQKIRAEKGVENALRVIAGVAGRHSEPDEGGRPQQKEADP
jgi:sterol 3beta-glucosyltransferase